MKNKIVVSEKERGKGSGFIRVRRVTGYITGDLSTWNNAKRAEERPCKACIE